MNSDQAINFSCPKCGEKHFKVTAEQYAAKEYAGAICSGCSYVMTGKDFDDWVLEQAKQAIQDRLSSAFGDAFKKG